MDERVKGRSTISEGFPQGSNSPSFRFSSLVWMWAERLATGVKQQEAERNRSRQENLLIPPSAGLVQQGAQELASFLHCNGVHWVATGQPTTPLLLYPHRTHTLLIKIFKAKKKKRKKKKRDTVFCNSGVRRFRTEVMVIQYQKFIVKSCIIVSVDTTRPLAFARVCVSFSWGHWQVWQLFWVKRTMHLGLVSKHFFREKLNSWQDKFCFAKGN